MDVSDQQMIFQFRDSPEADAIARANRKVLIDAPKEISITRPDAKAKTKKGGDAT